MRVAHQQLRGAVPPSGHVLGVAFALRAAVAPAVAAAAGAAVAAAAAAALAAGCTCGAASSCSGARSAGAAVPAARILMRNSAACRPVKPYARAG